MPDACSMLMEPHGYDEECSMLMEPQGHTNRCLMLIARNLLGGAADGSAETNAGCGDDNTLLFDFGQDRLWRGSHQGYGGNLVTTIGI